MIYLDSQATTRCDPRVVAAMLPFFTEDYANPHSAEHAMGRAAEASVDHARETIAALIGAEGREIVLTSGATEANNLAIKGAARHALAAGDRRRRIVTVATEHPCVLNSVLDLAAEGFEPIVLPVGADGKLDPAVLAEALRVPTLLVSVMHANNETGVVQDVAALSAMVRAAGALMHVDAAQSAGKIPLSAAWADLISVSGHKLYAPKGVGALYVRRRPRVRLSPLFSGGGQERGMRSGTLASALIAGLAAACALARAEMADEAARTAALRDRAWHALATAVPGMRRNGAPGLPGALNVTFPVAHAASLLAACPDICLSTGSACASAELAPSHVLTAMGLDPAACARSLRLSMGRFTSAQDVDAAVRALAAAHHALSPESLPCPA